MQILKVTDEAFRQYGKVIKDLDHHRHVRDPMSR